MATQQLNLTQEEWAALLAAVGIPEPPGIATLDPSTPPDAATLSTGARSLVGRGLVSFEVADSEDDLHPLIARLLVALFDAEETVSLTVAYSGSLASYAWYAIGEMGVAFVHDQYTNLRFEIAPLADVVEQATTILASLKPARHTSEQHPVGVDSLSAVLSALLHRPPTAARLPTESGGRVVNCLGSVHCWVRRPTETVEESALFVGLPEGNWTVDSDGEAYSLSQMKSPWPSLLNHFCPTP